MSSIRAEMPAVPAETIERSHGRSPGFRKDIQGLRAVAILMVLGYHAGLPGFGGGFAGVDVFFAISGYLIIGLFAVSWLVSMLIYKLKRYDELETT